MDRASIFCEAMVDALYAQPRQERQVNMASKYANVPYDATNEPKLVSTLVWNEHEAEVNSKLRVEVEQQDAGKSWRAYLVSPVARLALGGKRRTVDDAKRTAQSGVDALRLMGL